MRGSPTGFFSPVIPTQNFVQSRNPRVISARCTYVKKIFVNIIWHSLKFNDEYDDKNNENTNKNDNGSRIS